MKTNLLNRKSSAMTKLPFATISGMLLLASCSFQDTSAQVPATTQAELGTQTSLNARAARLQARNACAADLSRLCPSMTPRGNQREALQCLRRNRDEVSPGCRDSVTALLGRNNTRQMRGDGDGTATKAVGVELAYGSEPLQDLRFSPARCATGKAPIVVFVHGGAWTVGDKDRAAGNKARFFNEAGYHFATVNYRLRPGVTVDQSAQDVANAIAYLQKRGMEENAAAQNAIDMESIILQGHSSGAHLAALVALDPSYLQSAGVKQSDIKAVSLLDGAGYDIEQQVEIGGNAGLYREVFGSDKSVWRSLSPITHVEDSGAGSAFVLHYVKGREAARLQANDLAASIIRGSGSVVVHPAENRTHASLNRMFGDTDDVVSQETLSFIERYAPPCEVK